jgi:CelD/BcsL family acetyltransferase involved in cellulose biosynthesis
VGELALEGTPDLTSVRDDWTRLAQEAGNVFGTWEWADAWYRNIGSGAGVRLAVAVAKRPTGEPAAILPLAVTRRGPLRLVRFVGAGPADELGPVCAPQDRSDAAAALRRHVSRTLAGSGLFLGEQMWGEHGFASALGGTVVRRLGNPVLPIAGRSFDEFLASRRKHFRDRVRQSERKLQRAYAVTYRLTRDVDEVEGDMRTLMRLHEARWSDGDTTAFRGARGSFHLDFAATALRSGWLRLWTMELDQVPVAAWYGLRYGGIEFHYQSGRDPSFDADNVGFAVLCHSIRSAFEDGMREYRFGKGDEAYKARFAEYDPGLETVALAAGAIGRIGLGALRASLRLPDDWRRRARWLGGLQG